MHDKSGNPPENTELYRDLPPPFDDAFSSSSRAPFRTHFACITLNRRDRIRFLNFPPDVVRDMAGVIRSAWPRGIDSERAYNKALEIKVYGNPWGTDRAGDDDARRLVRRLLEGLYDRGWVLQAAVDITKKELDKGRWSTGGHSPCLGSSCRSLARSTLTPSLQTPKSFDIRARRLLHATGSPSHSTGTIASSSSTRRPKTSLRRCCRPTGYLSAHPSSWPSTSRSSSAAGRGGPAARTPSRRPSSSSNCWRRWRCSASACT